METKVEVHYKSFILDPDLVPSTDDVIQANNDNPAELEQLYREAGFTTAARNAAPLHKARVAGTKFEELPTADYQLFAGYLSRAQRPEDSTTPPPREALPDFVKARKSGFLDSMTVLTRPETGESLLLGVVNIGTENRYFKVGQWTLDGKPPTTLDYLRKQKKVSRAIARALQSLLNWRPAIKLNLQKPQQSGKPFKQRHPFVWFGGVTALCAGFAWAMFLVFDSWWAMAPAMVFLMICCGTYVDKKLTRSARDYPYRRPCYDEREKLAKILVGWMIALNIVGLIPSGILHLIHYETNSYTEKVLVCGTFQRDKYDNSPVVTIIQTNNGEMTVEHGFYDGTFYKGSTQHAAEQLVGKWVEVTAHGHLSGGNGNGSSPYVTAARILSPGSCADTGK